MNRYDIINLLIEKRGYSRYLEIGTADRDCFDRIVVGHKECVDIAGEPTYKMTSDKYFATHRDEFDIIFVDGDHAYEQARSDIFCALARLREGGIVVAHDANPLLEAHQVDEYQKGCWMGGVWKAIADLRLSPRLLIRTVDTDCGVCLIEPTTDEQPIWFNGAERTFGVLEANRDAILNIIDCDEFRRSL